MFRTSRSVARKPARTRLKLESFENRIVPASAVAHFFEADEDRITVKTNKGTSAQLLATLNDQVGAAITEGGTGVTRWPFHKSLGTPCSWQQRTYVVFDQSKLLRDL